MSRRLVIVSNRVSLPGSDSASGLGTGVLDALKKTGGLWFGWSGEVVNRRTNKVTLAEDGRITFATVDLNTDEYADYYNGYANRTLWPLFHYRVDLAAFDRGFYPGYQRVNAKFAQLLAGLMKPRDLVWVHDYHLIPLGEELRRAGAKQPLGFFLHIPFPAPPVFSTLYNHKKLTRHLLSYDLVGFQTQTDVDAFVGIVREFGGEVGRGGVVRAFGRTTRCAAFPIGIDVEEIRNLALSPAARAQTRRSLEGMGPAKLVPAKLVIGVDRLDYSKGLPDRLAAFELMLENYPGSRGGVTLVQIAAPTRQDVPEYVEIRRQLETAAGHINGRFGELNWDPVRYINRLYRRRSLAGLYRVSAIGLVTPLRDGMNLVAKEFVACQDPKEPGVLILSRFAGAAQQMKEAIIVNPYDPLAVAEALQRALHMELGERKERWEAMIAGLRRQDLGWWRTRFLATLAKAAKTP